MDKMKNLLQHVSIIQKKYDDLAEYTGEHYNVFDVLGVNSKEVSHSAILANLLDAKGKHRQKDIFLKLFFDVVQDKFTENEKKKVLKNFNSVNSHAITEKHTGGVDYERAQGGRIDILINDGVNNIIIENKLYAVDQIKQLERYNNYCKSAPIFYLTLRGTEPSEGSKGNLISNECFVCISYKEDILKWLKLCIKEMANKPFIRETLNQYLYLIKDITNQTSNNQMSEDIINIMKNNLSSSFEISNNIEPLKSCLYYEFMQHIKNFADKNKMTINIESIDQKTEYGLGLTPDNWKNSSYEIRVIFESKDYTGLYVGVKYLKELNENNEVSEKFKDKGFQKSKWGVWRYTNNNTWGNDSETWNSVASGESSKEYVEIIRVIDEILDTCPSLSN